MFFALIAALLVGAAPPRADSAIYCLETGGNTVPLGIDLSAFAQALRRKYGYAYQLRRSTQSSGILEFRGGYESIETVTYRVGFERGIVLKQLHVQQIVEEERLIGDPMCGWTANLLMTQP